MKKCPYCAEQIQDSAKKCRFCGEFLMRDWDKDQVEKNKSRDHRLESKSWKKTFYWTLGIGILVFFSWISNTSNGGDSSWMVTGLGIVLASFGYLFIQKRITWKKWWIFGEIIIGWVLLFFAFLSSAKNLIENPLTTLGFALFLSYYTYSLINQKIYNKWGRIGIKMLCVIGMLALSSFIILSLK
jgi:zinc-ribbon domain